MPERTSADAAAITASAVWGLPVSRFCRSRRKTFSTSTTASSTSSPMAMAIPPSVMVLIDRPKYLNTRIVIVMAIGIAVIEMKVVRQFNRNMNRTIETTTSASTRTRSTLRIDVSMKLACLNRTSLMRILAGTTRSRSASAASTCRVRTTVSAPGCFCTDRITAALPMKPPSPRLMPGAKSTAATCRNGIGCPSRTATTRLRKSSSRAVRPMLRIKYSRPA